MRRTDPLPVHRRRVRLESPPAGSTAGAWVEGDLDVLRGEREPELTLFVA